MTLWLWYDPSNVSQYVRRLYDMDEPIRNVCIYYLAGSSFRTLLIWYVTWYELTNQNAVFPFLCPYMVFRVLESQNPPREPEPPLSHYYGKLKYSESNLKMAKMWGCFENSFANDTSLDHRPLPSLHMRRRCSALSSKLGLFQATIVTRLM